MTAEIRSTSEGTTMLLTLHHPERRNALTSSMLASCIEALNVAESNPDVKAVVLLGSGANFCSGLNVDAGHSDRLFTSENGQLFSQLIASLTTFPKPLVAALEGEVSNEGLALALSCDVVVAAENCDMHARKLCDDLDRLNSCGKLLAQLLPRGLLFKLMVDPEGLSVSRFHASGFLSEVTAAGQAQNASLLVAQRLAQAPQKNFISIKEMLAISSL